MNNMREHTQKAIGIIASEHGFCCVQMKFTNGYILSMNIGRSGYNDNRDIEVKNKHYMRIETNRIECAVFDPEDNWVTARFFPDGDEQVAGWQTMEQVENAMKRIMMEQV
jgi:hypothetical protein